MRAPPSRDLDKGYLVQRVNGLHVSDGDREGALVRLHGEMQGDGDLVRLLLIRANEQKAGMQLDRPRRFSALPIMPLDIERSKSFADWPQDQHDFWMYRLGNMALVQGPEDQLDRLSEYPARRDRMLLRADSRRFPLTNQLKDFADCTPALLEARQEESVRLIVEYWGIRYDKDARDLTKQNVDELSKTSPRPSHSSRRVTIRQVIDAGLLVPASAWCGSGRARASAGSPRSPKTVVSVWMTAPNIRLRPPRPCRRRRTSRRWSGRVEAHTQRSEAQ